MKIDKIYNNNVVQVLDDSGQELVVMGRGLAFGKKAGADLDDSLIEKVFVAQNQENAQEWYQIYGQLSEQEVALVIQSIALAEKTLDEVFELPFYLTFADHIHYALERTRQGIELTNPLSWEVRKFYPTEYELGKTIVNLVNEQMGVNLHEDEAASLALHFANAQKNDGLLSKNRQLTQMVGDILEIVRLHFGGELVFDEASVNYNRFATHVNYFAQRVLNGVVQGNNDAFLYEQVQLNYPEAFACTQKIDAYVRNRFDFPMSQDEEVYLTIHIQRLTAKIE